MNRRLFFLGLSFLLFVFPFNGRGSIPTPVDWWFRSAVAEADYIVVGKIVATPFNDRRVKERISILLVERDLAGNAAPGDSLQIHWTARRWYPDQNTIGSSTGLGADLKELTGVSALWVFEIRMGKARCSHPFPLTSENGDEIETLIRLLEYPPEYDCYKKLRDLDHENLPTREIAEKRFSDLSELLQEIRVEEEGIGN